MSNLAASLISITPLALPVPPAAGVQPRQDPGGTLRMNGVGEREREKTRETSLDRAKSVFYFLTTGFIPSERFQGTRCLLMLTQD